MHVGANFKDKLGKIKAHLTSLDDRQLGKPSLVIIFFLDIFILIAIFNGLDEHTRQLSSPDAYIPPMPAGKSSSIATGIPPAGLTAFRKSSFPPATAIIRMKRKGKHGIRSAFLISIYLIKSRTTSP